MTLTATLIYAVFALLLAALSHTRWFGRLRNWVLLAASVLAVYWLQPALPIRGLDFWLPSLTLMIAVWGWTLTSSPVERRLRASLPVLAMVLGLILAIALTRYISSTGILTPSRPPQFLQVLLFLAASAILIYLISLLKPAKTAWLWFAIAEILLFFVILKLPSLTTLVSAWLRKASGQNPTLASALDIRWLGFSYIAFRLIATLRDRQSGRLPQVTLQEYLIYLIFFPALSAGPIDRIERFITDLRNTSPVSTAQVTEGGRRFILGLFKKFVLADLLALFALGPTSAAQIRSPGWMWVSVYAYTLQIYLDFSGYTDIALGISRWLGFSLPENFRSPYLKPDLTRFWNNWHITLTMWFRAYFFNPLARALRSTKKPLPTGWVILISQLATMVLIGLWHGITWNFVTWGAWHGIGLFINNRWSESRKRRQVAQPSQTKLRIAKYLSDPLSTLLTFHFVALGWVWFALPSIPLSLDVFTRLFGVGG
jgi:D-alanyl-lipoteichoic acid acyltransferase DltB (MBOAT superfamily)